MADTVDQLHERVRLLEHRAQRHQRLTAVLALLGGAAALVAFRAGQQEQHATEIDAERINIVEPDGRLAMVIANSEQLPGVIIDGEQVTDRTGIAGMLFYNKGEEAGGLIYNARQRDDSYSAGAHLSFDQYKQDQVIFLSYQDNGQEQSTGLFVVDRPTDLTNEDLLALHQALERATGEERARLEREIQERTKRGEFGAQRIFLGSNREKTAMVRLKDTMGRTRIRIYVDSANVAKIEFLNENGEITSSIPE